MIHLMVESFYNLPSRATFSLGFTASRVRELAIKTFVEALLKLPVTLRTRTELNYAFLKLLPIGFYHLKAWRRSQLPLPQDT